MLNKNVFFKVFKNELQDLSMDVVKMSKKMDESCQGFKWVLCEKLQDFQVYANDVNGTEWINISNFCDENIVLGF